MEKDFGCIFLGNGRFCCVMHDEYGEATLTMLQALRWQAGRWLLAKSQQSQNLIFPMSADSSSKLCKSQKP
jgi:hypothetical protein